MTEEKRKKIEFKGVKAEAKLFDFNDLSMLESPGQRVEFLVDFCSNLIEDLSGVTIVKDNENETQVLSNLLMVRCCFGVLKSELEAINKMGSDIREFIEQNFSGVIRKEKTKH